MPADHPVNELKITIGRQKSIFLKMLQIIRFEPLYAKPLPCQNIKRLQSSNFVIEKSLIVDASLVSGP